MKRGVKPIGTPFPYIARHVVQPKFVRTIAVDRGSAKKAIFLRIGLRENPLPNIALVLIFD
jgi:hypothetical protein